jgi:hypothetical protein
MGPAYEQLPLPLRQFHALSGRHALQGWVKMVAPKSAPARWMAWCLGTPGQGREGAIRFELEAGEMQETWTRHFPHQVMRSRLLYEDGHVVERLGPAKVRFRLEGSADRLSMKLAGMHFLGVPCPRWLAPDVLAEETASPGRLHFRIRASLPLVGVVTDYQGWLEVPT